VNVIELRDPDPLAPKPEPDPPPVLLVLPEVLLELLEPPELPDPRLPPPHPQIDAIAISAIIHATGNVKFCFSIDAILSRRTPAS